MVRWRNDLLAAIPLTEGQVPRRREALVALRGIIVQGATLAAVAAVLWWLAHNTLLTLQERDIPVGFDFLGQPANFDIGDTGGLRFDARDTIGRAIVVGLANTLRIAALGCVLSVLVGSLLGILRLTSNATVRGAARAVVEVMRNTPLLLLLLFLDATIRQLPGARDALHPVRHVFLSDRGLALPSVGVPPIALVAMVLVAGALLMPRGSSRMRRLVVTVASVAGTALMITVPSVRPIIGVPCLAGFNFVGGWMLSPEFAALLGALVLHHSAHISEVVRGAILSVPRGQQEAARALGLSTIQVLRLVTVPRALRAMVPLLVTNCVSLVKNSSLAVAIGFPDLVSVLNTTGNQTGRNIEAMLIMVVTYLAVSLGVAGVLGRYNARLIRRTV